RAGMQRRRHRLARLNLIVMIASALLAGCYSKPKAPALIDESVFQCDEGFRFLVPEGWVMAARGNGRGGPPDKEQPIVQYRRAEGDTQATLEVSAADLPEDANLADTLSGPSFSASHWRQSGSLENLEAGGRPAARYRFTARVNNAQLGKEVTAFRR